MRASSSFPYSGGARNNRLIGRRNCSVTEGRLLASMQTSPDGLPIPAVTVKDAPLHFSSREDRDGGEAKAVAEQSPESGGSSPPAHQQAQAQASATSPGPTPLVLW